MERQLELTSGLAKTLEVIARKLDRLDDVTDRLADVKDSVIDAKVAIDDVKFAVEDVKSVAGNVEEAVDDLSEQIAKSTSFGGSGIHSSESASAIAGWVEPRNRQSLESSNDDDSSGPGAPEDRCLATTSKGTRCRFPASQGAGYCLLHEGNPSAGVRWTHRP